MTADGASPDRWLFVLHGIYGAGRNWKSVARRLVDTRPDWGAVLVDLREHGGSRGFDPPHTLERAADDLARLIRHLDTPGTAVLGHSFGGKVALLYARRHDAAGQLWIVDSTPEAGPPSGSAWEMLGVLRRVPDTFDSRAAAVQAVEDEGVARPIAQWVSTNLERRPDGTYRWALDLDAMEALLRDFFRTDLWDVVDSPPDGARVHFIKAERSSVLPGDVCARIQAAGQASGRVFLHRLEGGHWLNADNPDAVVELLSDRL